MPPFPELLPDSVARLRAATTCYVRRLRGAGVPPEQTLSRVHALVQTAATAEGWDDAIGVQALAAEVERWSMAVYFDQ